MERKQRTVVAVTDGTLMSVAAWCKTLAAPTPEEEAITEEQIMARNTWEAPDNPAEVPAFIGKAPAEAATWERSERPEDEKPTEPAPGRPAKPAAAAPKTDSKSWMGSDLVWKHMDADRQSVLDAATGQLATAGVNIPNSVVAQFVLVKKTASGAVTSAQNYKKWINLIDFETLPWDRIERELERGLFHLPDPFLAGPQDSVTLFVNSNNFEPRSGSRQIVGTLWVIIHYILAKSERALPNGLSVVIQGDGMSYSKFYPAIQRCILDSLQSVLPVRITSVYMVDPPYIFKVLWGIVSNWLTEKIRNRVFVCSSSNVQKHFDKSQTPTWLKGDKVTSPSTEWDKVKAFYEKEFLPTVLATADAPGSGKHPDLWEAKK